MGTLFMEKRVHKFFQVGCVFFANASNIQGWLFVALVSPLNFQSMMPSRSLNPAWGFHSLFITESCSENLARQSAHVWAPNVITGVEISYMWSSPMEQNKLGWKAPMEVIWSKPLLKARPTW